MKPLHFFPLAFAVVLGTGLLLSQDSPKPAEPQPEPANPPARGERPSRRAEDHSDDRAYRPPRPNPPPGERPYRPEGYPDDRPYRPPPPPDGRDDGRRPFAGQQGPVKLQPFLGVVTRVAGPDLAAQLKLSEGFGLIVDDVLHDGPAAAAGVQPNDLLRMLDDQLLVNPGQLEALVRRAGKDKEVTLTILREGAEQKLTVKIGEKMLPVRRPLQSMNGPDGEPFAYGPPRQPRDGNRPFDDFRGPGRADSPYERETRYVTDRARVVRRDDSGTYEIERVNGSRILSARKPDGTLLWKGPVDTEENRKAMPDEVRQKFEEIEKSRPLDRLGDRPNRPGDGDPDQPRRRPANPGDPDGPRRPGNPPPPRDSVPQ